MPVSDGSNNCASPHADRDGGPHLPVDWDEVLILDPLNVKQIFQVFQTGEYCIVLWFMWAKCLFKTVKRILLPLNTSWGSIVITNGTYWMLAEIQLASDNVFLYDWISGKPRERYEQIAGACAPVCPCPLPAVSLVTFHMLTWSIDSLSTSPAAPRYAFLAILHECCAGICPAASPQERSTNVISSDAQQNSYACGVWTLYALHTRILKRDVKKKTERLFQDMDLKTPSDALKFRCMCLFSAMP